MVITVRGTDYSHNQAAHVTAMLAAMNAVKHSRKSLILQLNQGTPIESLLIGKMMEETNIQTRGFIFEDDGIDALLLRAETQRLMKDHFDGCCLAVLEAENLLDVATMSKKVNFEKELPGKKEELESVISGAKAIYDDIYVFADGKNPELLELVNGFTDLSVICIAQTNKEAISCIPENHVYLVTQYDKNSTYNIRFLKNMYKAKDIAAMPFSIEFKDAYNSGTMMRFIKVNEKVGKEDITYPLMNAMGHLIDKYMESGDTEEEEITEIEALEHHDAPEMPQEELTEFEMPDVRIKEKKRFFSKKTKKVIEDNSAVSGKKKTSTETKEPYVDDVEETVISTDDEEDEFQELEDTDEISVEEQKSVEKNTQVKKHSERKCSLRQSSEENHVQRRHAHVEEPVVTSWKDDESVYETYGGTEDAQPNGLSVSRGIPNDSGIRNTPGTVMYDKEKKRVTFVPNDNFATNVNVIKEPMYEHHTAGYTTISSQRNDLLREDGHSNVKAAGNPVMDVEFQEHETAERYPRGESQETGYGYEYEEAHRINPQSAEDGEDFGEMAPNSHAVYTEEQNMGIPEMPQQMPQPQAPVHVTAMQRQKNTGEWVCERCGTRNLKKFCSACGTKNPALKPVKKTTWVCMNCGEENPNESNFCEECGEKRPEEKKNWVCGACGIENPWQTKWCLECGEEKTSVS